jgi:7-carboxy-7-deazaguanine synthase
VFQRSGDELKLVWPQNRLDPLAMESWQFDHFLIQPMDRGSVESNQQCREAAIAFVSANPKWRLSLQNHKLLGLP